MAVKRSLIVPKLLCTNYANLKWGFDGVKLGLGEVGEGERERVNHMSTELCRLSINYNFIFSVSVYYDSTRSVLYLFVDR